jgi:pentatricopeptide repeat protein
MCHSPTHTYTLLLSTGIEPTVETYEMLLERCAHYKREQDALKLYFEMLKNELKPTENVFVVCVILS